MRQSALDLLAEEVRDKAILSGHIPGVENKTPLEILIPPVALPIADQQLLSLRGEETENRPDRSDLATDVADGAWLLIAAEEGFGLTSSLEWTLWQSSSDEDGPVPILLDYRLFTSGTTRSARKEVWKRLRIAGFDGGKQSDFPPLAIAVDNFAYSDRSSCSRFLRELSGLPVKALHVGVRNGGEAAAMAGLRKAFTQPFTLRYLSTLQASDVHLMSLTVDVSLADELSQLVMNITSRERILRTPFNTSLMLAVALQSESYASSASSTSLIEAYIESLLGRGDPADDPRLHMDYRDRFEVLASFAELLVRRRRGSVSTAEFMVMLDEFFEAVGWSQSSVELLDEFEKSRIVRHSGNQVAFTQNAFLFYFAAQRARTNGEFRSIILGDPIYYGKVVRAYSAVVRDDPELLRIIVDLARSFPVSLDVAPDGVFASTRDDEEKIELDDLMKHLEPVESVEEQVFDEAPERFEPQVRDEEPFPLDDPGGDDPDIARLSRIVFLCSTVLRDLDLVRDVRLKLDALSSVLKLWGQLAEDLSLDVELREMTRRMARDVATDLQVDDEKADEFTELFVRNFPMFVIMSGVVASLTSVKLERLLSECLSEPDVASDPRPSISGAIAVFALQQRGWTEPFSSISAAHSSTSVASSVLEVLGRMAYEFHALSAEDEENLHDLLVDRLASRVATRSAAERSRVHSQISQTLRRGRMLRERERLGHGESILTGLPRSRPAGLPRAGETPG